MTVMHLNRDLIIINHVVFNHCSKEVGFLGITT